MPMETVTVSGTTRRKFFQALDAQEFGLSPNALVYKCDVLVVAYVIRAIMDSGCSVNRMHCKAYAWIESDAESLHKGKMMHICAYGTELETGGYVDELEGIDMLLGLKWLKGVGVIVDFRSMTVTLGR